MKSACNSTLSKSMKIADVIEGKIFSPPEVFLKLRDTMGDPQHTFSDLEKILEADPVLTARLLKIANSVFD
jgi:HD-like signal output (HDOD) protein